MAFIKCIIIEDEPLARVILEDYIAKDDRLILLASYKSAVEALRNISTIKPDLIFLDINMPKINGFDFLKSLETPPYVIFTTAEREHALEGFNLNAVDFLLKPFSLSRFLQAVNKAYDRAAAQKRTEDDSVKNAEDHIFVKADGKLIKFLLADIHYCESLKEYVRIVSTDATVVAYMSLQHIENNLPASMFYRIHRSFIVGLRHVKSIQGNMVHVNGHDLPISRAEKEAFMTVVAGERLI